MFDVCNIVSMTLLSPLHSLPHPFPRTLNPHLHSTPTPPLSFSSYSTFKFPTLCTTPSSTTHHPLPPNETLLQLTQSSSFDSITTLLIQLKSSGSVPNATTFVTLIQSFTNFHEIENLLKILENELGIILDTHFYNIALNALVEDNKLKLVEMLHSKMVNEGVVLDVSTFNVLIKALCKAHQLRPAILMLEEMANHELKPDEKTFTTLMQGFIEEGTGFQSKGSYLFGHFSMNIKMVPGDSAGTVTAFYLSSQNAEHDEIDFEFLGNRTGQPYILQTNVFTGGQGNREQRIFLWFDPTKAYHRYSVLWNMYQIVFFVDNIPIRVFKNSKKLGVKFPFDQPMKVYNSLWNADDWATRGGLEKTDWSKAPFIAGYKSFHIDGCETSVNAKYCASQGRKWWNQPEFRDLDAAQWKRIKWVRKKFTIYNYCTDRTRFPQIPPECRRDRDI